MFRRCSIFLLPVATAIFAVGLSGATATDAASDTAGLTQYTIGNPSGDETEILETINRSRSNPAAEGQRLVAAVNANYPNGGSGIDLTQLLTDFQSYPFRPPLAFNADLNVAAAGHLSDMIAMGVESHNGSDNSTPNGRMIAAGYLTPTGENVFGNASPYSETPWEIEAGYEIDEGTPDLGHRLSIMEWDDLGEVEVGIANQAVGPWNVEDFGSNQTPPLLTGAVFSDNAKTGFYVSGEGMGGYTVTAPGASSYYAVTVASGAYTLPLDLVSSYAPSVPAPTVTVNYTDPSGNVTTRTVTLTHTDGPGILVYEDRTVNDTVVVRYDNAESDLILPGVADTYPSFFNGQSALSGGVYYLAFPNGNYFGYYTFLPEANYLYHFDMGYEYVFDAKDGKSGIYLYDFKSNGFFYTSPNFPFPYLYDFALNSVVYYYPDPNTPGHYDTNGVRYFYVANTGQIVTK